MNHSSSIQRTEMSSVTFQSWYSIKSLLTFKDLFTLKVLGYFIMTNWQFKLIFFLISLASNTNHKQCHLLYSHYSLHLLNGIVNSWKARNQSFTDILLNSGDNALNVVGSQSEYFKLENILKG